MSIFKCKMCGGTIEFEQGATVGVCDSCGTKQTLPKLDDDKRAQLFERANSFRRDNEFDKAMGIYEIVLSEDKTDAEAYWDIVLCKYGIEYVEDPKTHKRIPTVNRAQYTSIYDDENYKLAVEYADVLQKEIYEAEAEEIDKIQKSILEISSKEEPFDVFICYKETDSNGRRTKDSVIAQNIYNELTQEGYKVFFSRITLEDKLGSAYEPYIFAALHSAKVMLVVGTSKENFNAVWVKNEWSRYLGLINQGEKKTIIPLYEDIDPKDLPDEFIYIQAQDMSKVGFLQDLVRGIKKLISAEDQANYSVKQSVNQQIIDTMKIKAEKALKEKDWEEVIRASKNILDYDYENQNALLWILLAKNKVTSLEELKKVNKIAQLKNAITANEFKKLQQNGEESIKNELNDICAHFEKTKKKNKRIKIISICCVIIASLIAFYFTPYGQYSCNYVKGKTLCLLGKYQEAANAFSCINETELSNNSMYKYYEKKYKDYPVVEAYNELTSLRTSSATELAMNILRGNYELFNVGDVFSFGYDSENNCVLEWIILDKTDKKMYVTCKTLVGEYSYDAARGNVWADSSIRAWLNSNFYKQYFSSEEHSFILHTIKSANTNDYITLLSISDMNTQNIAFNNLIEECSKSWWLINASIEYECATYVRAGGEICESGAKTNLKLGVRPAMWISIE